MAKVRFAIILSLVGLILMGCSTTEQFTTIEGMVYIPGGTFKMGSNSGNSDEQPVHTVKLNPYWIDSTEVTNAMYRQCVADGTCNKPGNTTRYSNSAYDHHPVVYVSWYDAKAYCEWAGKQLPTEAQWEFAARGTDGRIYPWGDTKPNCSKANYSECVGDTVAVSSYDSGKSPYGVYDMAGNVWEWVADWYGSYPASSQSNPTGPSTGNNRVLRSGSVFFDGDAIRSSFRATSPPKGVYDLYGFRCSLTP